MNKLETVWVCPDCLHASKDELVGHITLLHGKSMRCRTIHKIFLSHESLVALIKERINTNQIIMDNMSDRDFFNEDRSIELELKTQELQSLLTLIEVEK